VSGVRTRVVFAQIATEGTSITARYGRKYGLYGLWFYLVLSVIFESVAYRWELWVSQSDASHGMKLNT
jgi:hypothetical protein